MTSLFQTKTRFAIFLQSDSFSQVQNRVLTRIYYPEVFLSFTMTKKFTIVGYCYMDNYPETLLGGEVTSKGKHP